MADSPAAFFITFRAYGTWLPGDPRGSTGWHQSSGDSPSIAPDERLELRSHVRLKTQPIYFDARRRDVIEAAVREVCVVRGWNLLALNVRTNHVHVVVQCYAPPEQAMTQFKGYATRRMVAAGALPVGSRPWSRHGSTHYLWDERAVEETCAYVTYGQGSDL
ncbi:MAG: transposase [Tepidiformaceae bacterium]